MRRRVEADSPPPASALSQDSPWVISAPPLARQGAKPHRLLTCSLCSGAQVCHSARAQRRPRVTAHTPWGFSTPELKATLPEHPDRLDRLAALLESDEFSYAKSEAVSDAADAGFVEFTI